MTIQEKKDYLKQYKRAIMKIAALEESLVDVRLNQLPCGFDYAKDKVQTSPSNDAMDNYVIRMDELLTKLHNTKVQAVNTCTEILGVISTIDNDKYQTVLHRRYILLQSWEEIAASMNYSVQWVYLTHGEALAELDIKKIREN